MRLYLWRQDIQELNGVSAKTALEIMTDIRNTYHLPKKHYVSVKAYCKYFSVDKDDVYEVFDRRRLSS